MKLYWGTVRARSGDFEGLWIHAKVRPSWYWLYRRVRLFAIIVWRRHDTARLDWRTAWDVASVAGGLGPCEVHRGPVPGEEATP